uniref:Vacuolar protein sorting-associated protein 26A n=1 Tax=Salmo salar TaxID=8030 RepID=B5X6E7_SALSA|nr:Vacuolar protein sorting-associated protein 26A [Salmo salar]
MSFLGGLFGPVCEIDVLLNDAETRKTAELKTEDGKVEKNYLFYDGESVSGKVSIAHRHTLGFPLGHFQTFAKIWKSRKYIVGYE